MHVIIRGAFVCMAIPIVASHALAYEDTPARALERAHSAVRAVLEDRSDLQFTSEVHFKPPNPSEYDDFVVCGEVNARNADGSDLGFTKFLVIGKNAVVRVAPLPFDYFDDMWQDVCVERLQSHR